MMRALEQKAQAIARLAERRRLEEVAAAVRARGFVAQVEANAVVSRGRNLLQAWLSDPLLRFAGRRGA
ncbi:MAG TPA: hypothetical protein VMK31_07955 [Sphingomicrobium sp.]|nr:hypothetical protein [Sphingomicrobium sp.]